MLQRLLQVCTQSPVYLGPLLVEGVGAVGAASKEVAAPTLFLRGVAEVVLAEVEV
jgi:hypothetical protein